MASSNGVSNGTNSHHEHNGTSGSQTESPMERAKRLLKATPLIDGHNDFPFLLRQQLLSQIYDHDLRDNLGCHTSLEKMRRGMMGGQFWSIYVPNPEEMRLTPPSAEGAENGHVCGCEHVSHSSVPTRALGLNEPNHAVRDTLEQIDLTHRLITTYPTYLKLCTNPSAVREAHRSGHIASMLGIEGGHSTGNSIAALRMFYHMGVRYMTLTHNSENAFGTSWVSVDPVVPGAKDHGLTSFGESCVKEMNRLGMLVDLSHVSTETMRGALQVAKAPVIYSHSGARAVTNHGRNAPDDVLQMVKQNRGVVMVPAVAPFMREKNWEEANVEDMLDHIVHIARLIGWEHVGLGSDFDGTTLIIKGFEDTSKWPELIARLIEREHVTDEQIAGLLGENVLRAWSEAEEVAKQMQNEGVLPSEENWEGRIWEPFTDDVPMIYPKK